MLKNLDSMKLTEDQRHFAEYLKEFHSGKNKAITAKRLKKFAEDGKVIRNTVHDLRVIGIPICSGKNGYYYGETSEEINETLKFLHSFIIRTTEVYDGLKDTYYEKRHDEIVEKSAEQI